MSGEARIGGGLGFFLSAGRRTLFQPAVLYRWEVREKQMSTLKGNSDLVFCPAVQRFGPREEGGS